MKVHLYKFNEVASVVIFPYSLLLRPFAILGSIEALVAVLSSTAGITLRYEYVVLGHEFLEGDLSYANPALDTRV